MTGRLKPVLIAAAGATSALGYAELAHASRRSPPLGLFFLCLGLAALGSLFVFGLLRNQPLSSSARIQLVGWAVLFRIIGFMGAPIYEDDFYRYLWDGRTFALTGTPYGQAPSAAFGREVPEKFSEILSRVNYPDIPTIYGPIGETAFLAAYWIAPGELWPLKLILLAADSLLLWILWRITGPDARWVLYAWSPLVIKEVAFTAHSDILVALLLIAAVWCRPRLGAAFLAAAVAAKITAVLFVPILLWKKRAETGVFAAVLGAIYLPFLLQGATEFEGLKAFVASWEFNSFGFGLIRWVAGWDAARTLSGILLAAWYAFYVWRWRDLSQAPLLLAVFFLLTPVVNPWYLLIFVPFVVLQPAAWSICATVTVLLAYVTGAALGDPNLGPFDHPWWVRPVELIPVLFLFLTKNQSARVEPKASWP